MTGCQAHLNLGFSVCFTAGIGSRRMEQCVTPDVTVAGAVPSEPDCGWNARN